MEAAHETRRITQKAKRYANTIMSIINNYDFDYIYQYCYRYVSRESDFFYDKKIEDLMEDASNIDLFESFNIYENLENLRFSSMTLEDKKLLVDKKLFFLNEHLKSSLHFEKATIIRNLKIEYQIEFYNSLSEYLKRSTGSI